MKNENVSKPITLLREDFIAGVLALCNNSNLPYFVVEDVLKDIVQEVHRASQQQIEFDKTRYYQSLEVTKSKEDG